MLKKAIKILTMAFVFSLSLAAPSYAADWSDFLEKNNQSTNKIWTIKFSKDLSTDTVNSNNVFVATDSQGYNKINGIKVAPSEANTKWIEVSPPFEGWHVGNTYYLFIAPDVRSSFTNGYKSLSHGLRMKFTITSVESYLEEAKAVLAIPEGIDIWVKLKEGLTATSVTANGKNLTYRDTLGRWKYHSDIWPPPSPDTPVVITVIVSGITETYMITSCQ